VRTLLLLSVLVAACSSKSANGSPKDDPAPGAPAAATPGAKSPAAPTPPTVAGGDTVAAAIEAARKRAATMNLGTPKLPAGPRVTLLDIAAADDALVQTGEIWHRFLLGGHSQWDACWRDAVKRGVTAEGLVTVSAKIGADGGLTDAKVEKTIDPALGKCIAGKVDALFMAVLAADAGARLSFTGYFEVIK
jgi:hypothetical protein